MKTAKEKALDEIQVLNKRLLKVEEAVFDMSDTAARYGLDPDFQDRGEQIKILEEKLAKSEQETTHKVINKILELQYLIPLDTLSRAGIEKLRSKMLGDKK